ncbi:TY3B protein [Salix suchowensis]|nr:TY3B protein [Salix suchowensis]
MTRNSKPAVQPSLVSNGARIIHTIPRRQFQKDQFSRHTSSADDGSYRVLGNTRNQSMPGSGVDITLMLQDFLDTLADPSKIQEGVHMQLSLEDVIKDSLSQGTLTPLPQPEPLEEDESWGLKTTCSEDSSVEDIMKAVNLGADIPEEIRPCLEGVLRKNIATFSLAGCLGKKVLSPYLWLFTLIYIDDIVVYLRSWDKHLRHLDTMLEAIAKAGVTLAPRSAS